jgi:hypothetical protein
VRGGSRPAPAAVAAAPPRPRGRSGRRWGGTINGLVATIALVGGLAGAAIVITPRLSPGAPAAAAKAAAHPEHQAALERLAALIGRSHAVLALHPRGRTPFVEVVLWLEDGRNAGVIDRDEVAVISHSEILRTITYHAYEPPEDPAEETAAAEPGDPVTVPAVIAPESAAGPGFCPRWRRSRHVVPRVLLTDVSDLRVVQVGEAIDGRGRLRIELIWSSDSADAWDEAWLEVELGARDHIVED